MRKSLMLWLARKLGYACVPKEILDDLNATLNDAAMRWYSSGHVNGELVRRRPKIVRAMDRYMHSLSIFSAVLAVENERAKYLPLNPGDDNRALAPF